MIRIISDDTYGMHKGNTVVVKTKDCGPFEMEPPKEAELVKLGIAEYVNETRHDDQDGLTREYLQSLKLDELKVLANEEFGIKFKFGTNKAKFIDLILDAYHGASNLGNEDIKQDNETSEDEDIQQGIEDPEDEGPQLEPFDPESPFAQLTKGKNDESI